MTENDQPTDQGLHHRPYPANGVLTEFSILLGKERLVITVLTMLLIVFTTFDYFEDRASGASAAELFQDVSDLILPLVLLVYIWRFKPLALFNKAKHLELDLDRKREDLQHWKSKASSYIKGMADTINQQFDRWKLSTAEKEVALLLLKGFSLRDIADLRKVSERTVRQQATRVYDKSGLRGRAELSAFFLEDLMLPEKLDLSPSNESSS